MLLRSTSPTTSTGPAAEASFLSSQRWTTGHEGAGSLGIVVGAATADADAGEELPAAERSLMRWNAGSRDEETLEPAAWTREEDSALSVAVGRSAVGDWEGVREAFIGVTGSQRSALALSERWEVLRLGQLTSRKFSRRPRPRSPMPSCSSDSFDRSSPDPLDFSREETTLRWLRVHHSATPPDQHSSPSPDGLSGPPEDSESRSPAKKGRDEQPGEMVGDPFVGDPPRRQGSPTDDAAIPPWLSSPHDEQRAHGSRSDAIRAVPSSDANSCTSRSAELDVEPDPPRPSRDYLGDVDFAYVADGLSERDAEDVRSVFSTDPDPPQQTSAPAHDALSSPSRPLDATATADPIELVVQGCALPTQTSPPRPAPAASSSSTRAPLEPFKPAELFESTSAPPRPSTSRRGPSIYRPSPNRSSTLQIETTHVRDDNPPPPFKPRLLIKGIAEAATRRNSTALRPSLPSRQVTSEPVEAAEPSTITGEMAQQRQSSAFAGSPTTPADYAPNPHEFARPASTSIQQQPSPPPSLPDTAMRDLSVESAGQDCGSGGGAEARDRKASLETVEELEQLQASLDAADRLRKRLREIAASLRA